MCKLKSAIILKDKIYIPDHDHHTQMLEELGVKDTRQNAEMLFVRAELVPKNNDIFSPITEWEFHVDQDIIPEWFVVEYEKERMIAAVIEWGKTRIYVGKDDFSVENSVCWLENCKRVIFHDSTVKA